MAKEQPEDQRDDDRPGPDASDNPSSPSDEIDDEEIARMEAEMAAAVAAEEAATATQAGEASDDEIDEEEIARAEAEMAAAVADEEAAEDADDSNDVLGEKDYDYEAERPVREVPSLGPIENVSVPVSVVIFEKDLTIGELLGVEVGSILRGHSSDEPLQVRVGKRPLAWGRAVVVDDRFGVIIDDLVDS